MRSLQSGLAIPVPGRLKCSTCGSEAAFMIRIRVLNKRAQPEQWFACITHRPRSPFER